MASGVIKIQDLFHTGLILSHWWYIFTPSTHHVICSRLRYLRKVAIFLLLSLKWKCYVTRWNKLKDCHGFATMRLKITIKMWQRRKFGMGWPSHSMAAAATCVNWQANARAIWNKIRTTLVLNPNRRFAVYDGLTDGSFAKNINATRARAPFTVSFDFFSFYFLLQRNSLDGWRTSMTFYFLALSCAS